ncbi:MAG: CoA transferase [SAR202 cluster bacterium]|jgi:crotonobetainyl-CoA:carnitine CoA-transferase CaiB-like acyl-CoA transferase|nr:CoA transferase [SAR202 cluster bacterium]MDP7414998.1 CoA transferase [SAR202 cluster bacterium]HJO81816.1 CoA transferase [SAR202 cluster bacterium]
MAGPLTDVRITDFTWVLAGPFCTRTLADMGAEVIKIEARNRPDPHRNYINRTNDFPNPSPYGAFDNFNRNKLGLTINSRHSDGLALIKDLIAVSDVVTENFRGGVLDRWGLSFDEMRKAKPDIISMSLSGFGQTGPYNNYASHFHIPQAMSGFTRLSGIDGDIPVVAGSWGDTTTGLQGAAAVCMALEHRSETGQGQKIDGTQLTSTTHVMGSAFLEYTANGTVPHANGNRLPHTATSVEGAFPCQGEERWVAVGVHTEDEWRTFCATIERTDLLDDSRFAAISDRRENWQELEIEVERWTRARTAEDAATTLRAAGIESVVVENVVDMMEHDKQLAHRGYFVDAWHPDRSIGTLRTEGPVTKFSDTQGTIRRTAPLIGEHNEYVLGEVLGVSTNRMAELQEAGVFF